MICCNESPNFFAFEVHVAAPIVECGLNTSVSTPASFNMFFSHPAAVHGLTDLLGLKKLICMFLLVWEVICSGLSETFLVLVSSVIVKTIFLVRHSWTFCPTCKFQKIYLHMLKTSKLSLCVATLSKLNLCPLVNSLCILTSDLRPMSLYILELGFGVENPCHKLFYEDSLSNINTLMFRMKTRDSWSIRVDCFIFIPFLKQIREKICYLFHRCTIGIILFFSTPAISVSPATVTSWLCPCAMLRQVILWRLPDMPCTCFDRLKFSTPLISMSCSLLMGASSPLVTRAICLVGTNELDLSLSSSVELGKKLESAIMDLQLLAPPSFSTLTRHLGIRQNGGKA